MAVRSPLHFSTRGRTAASKYDAVWRAQLTFVRRQQMKRMKINEVVKSKTAFGGCAELVPLISVQDAS